MRLFFVLVLMLVGVEAYAHHTHSVSNKGLNSFSCPNGEPVTDIFVSERSNLRIDTRKDKVFFEFLAVRTEDEYGNVAIHYTTDLTTMVLFCLDDEHTLILRPKNINGVSIVLPEKSGKKIKVELEGLKREEQIAKLVQMVLTDTVNGFRTTNGNQAALSGDKEFYLRKIHAASGYQLKEIYIYSDNETYISESELLAVPFIGIPIAMTLPDDPFTGWLRVIAVTEAP